MSGDVSEDLEKEILPFLSLSARPDLKAIAVQYVAGVTSSAGGCLMLREGEGYVDALVKLTSDDDPKVQKQTYDALINLTSYPESAAKVIGSTEVKDVCLVKWIKNILDKTYVLADSVSQLLTNLSRSETGADMLWSELRKADVSIGQLVDVLCTVNYNEKATSDYLASILSNLTQLPPVRRELLDAKQRSLQRLLAFVDYGRGGSEVRRRGAVGTIRNCCMEAGSHQWLLGEDVDILPRLLLPLAGGEEFEEEDMERLPEDLQYLPPDKQRESCRDIRVMLVEALIQLCNTKPGRQFVKAKNTYVIMRELYNWESDDGTKETIHDLIDILIGDEPPEHQATLKEVQIPADIADQFSQEDAERKDNS